LQLPGSTFLGSECRTSRLGIGDVDAKPSRIALDGFKLVLDRTLLPTGQLYAELGKPVSDQLGADLTQREAVAKSFVEEVLKVVHHARVRFVS
jgi:hypothetical protein